MAHSAPAVDFSTGRAHSIPMSSVHRPGYKLEEQVTRSATTAAVQ
jgi:hypothetical protein